MTKSFHISRLGLRDFHPEDLEQLVDIDQICFPEGIAYAKRDFRHFLRKKGSYVVLAEFNHRIVAFGITVTLRNQMHLVTLDVLPDFQGKKIGSLLLNHILNRARLDKIERIDLEVAEDNSKAIRFYRSRGFRAVKRLKEYYANNGDALLMTRNLSKPTSNWILCFSKNSL